MLYEVITVSGEPPSYDGHRESTFAMLHWTRPFYSVLIRVNPENPGSPTDFVGDLAVAVPEPTDGGRITSYNVCYTKLLRELRTARRRSRRDAGRI